MGTFILNFNNKINFNTLSYFRLCMAAISPDVIIPSLLKLQTKGYGIKKDIVTIMIVSSTINDIMCIGFSGIINGVIFTRGEKLKI